MGADFFLKLIAGLGNPGWEYAFTRHNMGWLVVDRWVECLGLTDPQEKFRSEFWRVDDVVLLKPLTFMNLSGLAVGEAVSFYKIEPRDVLVICDDLALPYGQLRLRAQGSAGGHNGLASVISMMDTLEVPRLRIGLGNAPGNMVKRVLGRLTKEESDQLPLVLDKAIEAIHWWRNLDIQKAMSRVNASPKKACADAPS